MSGRMLIPYGSEAERIAKLTAILNRLGYTVAPANPERITVGELAKRLNRRVACISRSLKRGSCPPFEHRMGKRRILWLEPNARLLAYLTT